MRRRREVANPEPCPPSGSTAQTPAGYRQRQRKVVGQECGIRGRSEIDQPLACAGLSASPRSGMAVAHRGDEPVTQSGSVSMKRGVPARSPKACVPVDGLVQSQSKSTKVSVDRSSSAASPGTSWPGFAEEQQNFERLLLELHFNAVLAQFAGFPMTSKLEADRKSGKGSAPTRRHISTSRRGQIRYHTSAQELAREQSP